MTQTKRRQLAQLLQEWAAYCTERGQSIYNTPCEATRKPRLATRIADNYIASASYALEVARLVDPDVGVMVKVPTDTRKRRTLEEE